MSKFYITTTLPYVNAKPHLGHALEFIQADVVARWRRLKGSEVFFNVGTDEHGSKIYEKAVEEGKDPQVYCDEYAQKFGLLKEKFGLSYNSFTRTTDKHHVMAVQEFWKKCYENGDIYKKNYKAKYCVGCELEKQESDLVDGKCPEHPNRELEIREEENYFFRFSKYQEKLLAFYERNPDFVTPSFRFNEIKKFVERGLQDFSISRLKSKMPWGIPVPNDDEHVIYVWFEALVNYVSAVGWPDKMSNFESWWPPYQVAGKDNLRQQTAMWQAQLMSAGLPNSKQVFIHGFITGEGGIKMSKTLGNVIDPIEVVDRYGLDSVRYYFLRGVHPFEDSDFTYEKFEERYNADLANGLGNLVSRLTNLIEKSGLNIKVDKDKFDEELQRKIDEQLVNYRFDEALKVVWDKITEVDVLINENKPWKYLKEIEKLPDFSKTTSSEGNKEIEDRLIGLFIDLANRVYNIAYFLQPFIPKTAEKVVDNLTAGKIRKSEILFPRLERE